jgi:transcriptional regulator with XRE-family HTH domain
MKKNSEVSEKEIAFRAHVLMEAFGVNLKKERINQKMSRTDLAFHAKTTESMICNLENCKKVGVSIYTLVKISQALDVNIWTLFEE